MQYININPPQVYMCSPSWTPLPPSFLYHLSGSSQCTSPKHPVSCIEPGLAICFLYDIIQVSMPFSQIIPPTPSPTESKRLFYTSVSLLLSCIQGYHYHLSKFRIYVFFGENDAKAETQVLWPPHVKSWLIGKDSHAGRDWWQEEKGTTEDEMAGWHHRLNGHESKWTLGVGDGQGGLACCDSWGRKESDTTERLNWRDVLFHHVWFSMQS